MDENLKQDYFDFHNENLKLLKIAFSELRNSIKLFITDSDSKGNLILRKSDQDSLYVETFHKISAYTRLLSGVQVSIAEENMKRLLYEKNVFNDDQIDYLLNTSALDQKWYKALKIVFCTEYGLVPGDDPTCRRVVVRNQRINLGHELIENYLNLRSLIRHQLIPSFNIRNKVQHGEWVRAFKPRISKHYSQDITDKVVQENLISVTSRFNIVNSVYQMIVDMARFKSNKFAKNSMITPFEYFYPRYIMKIEFEVNKLQDTEFPLFIEDQLGRYERGLIYKSR